MVVTLHDVAALKRPSEHLRLGARMHLRNLAMQRAAAVIVPTQAVAEDAISRIGLEPDYVTIIPEAPDPVMYPRSEDEVDRVKARFGLPERYLVWVGRARHPNPRKHAARLAAACQEVPLVLVGPRPLWTDEVPTVTPTGEVSDEQLAAIYSGAHAMVLPSEDEGFGLSAVEALACGTPVAAFDVPALREVLGDRASLTAPNDLEALVDAAEHAQRPAPAPPLWTWQDAGAATWTVYERALSQVGKTRAVVRLRPMRPKPKASQ
jgi:glycosyltransferase involved in cell wall biosynthesis